MGWGLRTHSAQPCIRAIRDIRILYRYMGPLRVGPQRHEYGTQRTRVRGLEFRVRGLGCTSAFSVIHIMISDLSPSKGRLFRVPVGPAEGAHTVCSVEGLKAQRSRDFTPKQRIKTSKKALIIRYPKKKREPGKHKNKLRRWAEELRVLPYHRILTAKRRTSGTAPGSAFQFAGRLTPLQPPVSKPKPDSLTP